MNPESNVVALRTETGAFSLTPTNLKEAMDLAKLMSDSELVPKDYRGKPGNVLVAVQMGAEIGLGPMSAMQSIAVINGKPGLYGDAGKALLLRAGCTIEEDDIEVIKKTGRARCKITRPGHPPCERTFAVENAKTAGLFGKEGPWKNHPERQMAWRAFWFAARDCAADILKGLHGREEAMDLPTEKDMGKVEEVGGSQSRAESVSDKLAGKTDPKAPTLDKVLGDIKAATTSDHLEAAAALASKLIDVAEKDIARKAWSDRVKALKTAPGKTYAEVADAINASGSIDTLNIAMDLIRSVADAEQQEELRGLAAQRKDAIEQG